jgi:hypothetical protein
VRILTEDIYFYLDLTKEILRKKELIKAIKYYIEEKNKANIKGHYSLLIFQEKGNPIFITDKKEASIITNAIEENWKFRPKKTSYFENGLFYIFSYIAETVRKKSKYNRIIVITDTPSDLGSEYQEALFNLVSKIKYFPTFIDIIRISEKDTRFYSDDVKLNVLVSDTKGGIFYVKDRKEFSDVIKKLVKAKKLVSTFADRPDHIKISKEDFAFYDKLARKLKESVNATGLKCHFCREEICPICGELSDIPLLCDSCNISFHQCCVTNYTIQNNIGIPHIFRCPNINCDVLLQIDQDLIVEASTNDNKIKSVEDFLEIGDSEKIFEIEEMDKPSFELEKTEEGKLYPLKDRVSEEKPKKVRIGGFFGKVYTVKKVGDKIVYEKATKTSLETTSKTEISESKESKITSNEQFKCPKCGTKL